MNVINIKLEDFLSYFIHTINNDSRYKNLTNCNKFEVVISAWEHRKFNGTKFNIIYKGKPLSPEEVIKRQDITFIVLDKYNEIEHHKKWFNNKYYHFYHSFKQKIGESNHTGNIRISIKPI